MAERFQTAVEPVEEAMSLIENAMEKCVFMEKKRVPDGVGSYTVTWTEGASFNAAITFDQSMQARIAEKQGVTSRYTVTTEKDIPLEYHDVIKRLRDNKILRITSDGDDKQTPVSASFQYLQVTAEEWIPA